MQHSVLVAFAKDKYMYPSGPTIISKTKPWPDGEIILKTEIIGLRPQFQTKMSEIPDRMKERIYTVRSTLRVQKIFGYSTLVYRNGSRTMGHGADDTLISGRRQR
jgi:hypothetical protein